MVNTDSVMDDVSVESKTPEVYQAINRTCDNKISSLDHIAAKNLNEWINMRIWELPHFSLYVFTGFMIHGSLPSSMLSVLLAPIVKDKAVTLKHKAPFSALRAKLRVKSKKSHFSYPNFQLVFKFLFPVLCFCTCCLVRTKIDIFLAKLCCDN